MPRMKLTCMFVLWSALWLMACGDGPSTKTAKKNNDGPPAKKASPVEESHVVVWAEWLKTGADGRAFLNDTNATFTGRVMDYYELEGGEGVIQTHFKNGLRHGPSTWWHWNGKLAGTVTYVNGKEQGIKTWWYENGRKMRELTHEKGQREGAANGWHETGKREFIAHWKNDKPMGDFTEWFPSGKVMTTRAYADGLREGMETHWYEVGQKAWEMNWRAGKRQGTRTEWYTNGKNASQIIYQAGQRHGLSNSWYQNGEKSSEITHDTGKETRHLEWDESGAPIDLTEDGWNPDGTPRAKSRD
jgi:antitoxin component YwqK of YwqJK toxin-antitoxin module